MLHNPKPVHQQTGVQQRAQRPQSVSEISSVSGVSSSCSPSVSNRFASADSSIKAPSDDTVISARSSLSSDSNSHSVSRGDVLNVNVNVQNGIVLNSSIESRTV